MIHYESGGSHHLRKVFQLHGSVFPRAFIVALPAALVSACLRYLITAGHLAMWNSQAAIMLDSSPWSGFSFFVGFLIVFRTSEAYSRFWEGCSLVHKMRVEWFDSCSGLVAFCKHSRASTEAVADFQGRLVRLFSMLHASALAAIEDSPSNDMEQVAAYTYELIDAEGMDEESLRTLLVSESKVELIYQWIQQLIVESIHTGVLCIPAPILSRAFQEIANGNVSFHEAMKISAIPFPFPYAQTCDCLLIIHWLIAPCVVSQWVSEPQYAAVFTFVQVFTLWSLNFIAVEVENPFGLDVNDIDGRVMHSEFNRCLLLLLRPRTMKTPALTQSALDLRCAEIDNCSEGGPQVGRNNSFRTLWASGRFSHSDMRHSSDGCIHEHVLGLDDEQDHTENDVRTAERERRPSISSSHSMDSQDVVSIGKTPSMASVVSMGKTSSMASVISSRSFRHGMGATPWAAGVLAASLPAALPKASDSEPSPDPVPTGLFANRPSPDCFDGDSDSNVSKRGLGVEPAFVLDVACEPMVADLHQSTAAGQLARLAPTALETIAEILPVDAVSKMPYLSSDGPMDPHLIIIHDGALNPTLLEARAQPQWHI